MNKTSEIKKKFPYISYEELVREEKINFYDRLYISIFNKVIRDNKLFEEEYKQKVNKYGVEMLNTYFYNLLLKLSSKSESYLVRVLGVKPNGDEIISIEKYDMLSNRESIIRSLISENDLKIIFPQIGIIFQSVFDLSAILLMEKGKTNIYNLNQIINDLDLFIISK